jgi:hypothetical protein
MEAAPTVDPSANAIDVAITVPTTPTASTATTAIAKPKANVKELTSAERKVQNQKRQARRVAERARKADALVVAQEEEKREAVLMHTQAQVKEVMKMRELLGEVRTNVVVGTTSSSSVTSQALRRPMLPWSPATLGTAAVPSLHVHASSQLRGARLSSRELALLRDDIAPPAIDLNCTRAPINSAQGAQK